MDMNINVRIYLENLRNKIVVLIYYFRNEY